jgi:phosphoribosylformimino-5-aminoimidazole carboxamide ribotide isomerase
MMKGLNLESTLELARAMTIPVIASGGITNMDDIRALCEVSDEGIQAAITGRAIYEGTLNFEEAQKYADANTKSTSGY